jgi:hypothetical protein
MRRMNAERDDQHQKVIHVDFLTIQISRVENTNSVAGWRSLRVSTLMLRCGSEVLELSSSFLDWRCGLTELALHLPLLKNLPPKSAEPRTESKTESKNCKHMHKWQTKMCT